MNKAEHEALRDVMGMLNGISEKVNSEIRQQIAAAWLILDDIKNGEFEG